MSPVLQGPKEAVLCKGLEEVSLCNWLEEVALCKGQAFFVEFLDECFFLNLVALTKAEQKNRTTWKLSGCPIAFKGKTR